MTLLQGYLNRPIAEIGSLDLINKFCHPPLPNLLAMAISWVILIVGNGSP
jgi:hypothetical protein